MKKTILLILVGSLLLLTVTGCLQNSKNEQTTPQNKTESTTPHQSIDKTTTPQNTTEENTTPEITTPEETTIPEQTVTPVEQNVSFEEVFGIPFMFFNAQPFIQDASIEETQGEMRVEVLDYGIYLPNAMYSYATVVEDPTIVYPKEIVSATDKDRDTVIDVLTEMQNSEICYVLKNSISTSTKIAVYRIANVYYIVTFYEGDRVAKIHYIDKDAELPPENNDVPAPNENGLFNNEEVSFMTKFFAGYLLSSWGGFEVRRTSNGEIYLDGTLYENIGVFRTPNIVYDSSIISVSFRNEEISKLLEKIRKTKSCYVLQAQGNNKYGDIFSIYYIDGIYYFLNEYDGKVRTIWCEKTNSQTPPEVTPPVSNFVPAPDGEKPFGNVQTSFTANIFANGSAMPARFPLEVEIDNGNIYLSNTLYECVGIIQNPEITYNQTMLRNVKAGSKADWKLEILEKIKSSETCYVLKAADEIFVSYLLYYIDGTYYFLNSINGTPTKIYYAATTTP